MLKTKGNGHFYGFLAINRPFSLCLGHYLQLVCIKAVSLCLAALTMQIGKKSNTKTSLLKMLNKGYLSTFSSLVSSSLVFLYFYSFFIVFFSFYSNQLNSTLTKQPHNLSTLTTLVDKLGWKLS